MFASLEKVRGGTSRMSAATSAAVGPAEAPSLPF
jgi:hypothetical protein